MGYDRKDPCCKTVNGKALEILLSHNDQHGTDTDRKKNDHVFSFPIAEEVTLWGTLALSVILFISNFGIGGFVGDAISRFFFGVFGFMAYLLPVILF